MEDILHDGKLIFRVMVTLCYIGTWVSWDMLFVLDSARFLKASSKLVEVGLFAIFILSRRRFLFRDDVVCCNNVSNLPLWFYASKDGSRFHDGLKTVYTTVDSHRLLRFL